MTIDNETAAGPSAAPVKAGRNRRTIGLAAAGALAIGLLVGGAGTALVDGGRHATLVLQPAPIASLENDSPAAIKGQVAEIFGNKVIVDDGSGRALVETGRKGEGGGLVAKGDTVTAQGRFDDGVLRAEMLVQANGKVVDLGPDRPPKGPPKGPRELAER